VRYFADAGSPQLPGRVRSALEFAATHRSPTDRLAFADTVKAYAFTSSTGDGAVYMTPYARLPGFCAALAVPGKRVQASCASNSGGVASVATDFGRPWNLQLTPGMHALLGRFAPSAAGDRVQIAFEDGTKDDVPMRGRWFAYAVAGKRTQAGHRPVALIVLRNGRVIRHHALPPVSFNTYAAARALVPAADGSRGQEAIRRYLLGGLDFEMADGGLLASHTDIARTQLAASLGFGHGLRVSIYAAPVRKLPQWRGDGAIVIGLDGRSARPVLAFGGVASVRGKSFDFSGGCVCAVPGSADAMYDFLIGSVPIGVSRVAVRTSDGHEHPATVLAGGLQWIWLGRDVPPRRPVALIGRNAGGTVVVTRRLHGRGGMGR
jgi:hypothetical protein